MKIWAAFLTDRRWRIYSLATLIVAVTLAARGGGYADNPGAREYIEWCDIWISHANETNLPRVLLIGDSITRDYYPGVEKHLDGRAYVGRLSSSAFVADPVLLDQLKMTLSSMKFDVIHFNNGMHGWQHSEDEYRKAFPKFIETIRRYAPRAKLIWASTTPLRQSPTPAKDHPTEATDERIQARNSIASNMAQKEGIPVDDLYSLMRGHPEYHRDNVHFNDQGIGLQAAQVAAQVGAALPNH
jgi:lysophospholipase L1-like esterase